MRSTATEVVIVRHGHTAENAAHALQGLDPRRGRLTARGLAEAEAVGRILAIEDFDRGYCSPLERAVVTLGRVLHMRLALRPDAPTLPLRFVDGLREMDVGRLSGQTHTEWCAAADEDGDPLHFRPPGGESLRDLQYRVGRWFDHVMRQGRGGRILVVAHGGVVRALLTHALGIPMSMDWAGVGPGLPARNASVARIGLVAGRVVAATADDTRHLAGLIADADAGVWWDLAEARWCPWPDGACAGAR